MNELLRALYDKFYGPLPEVELKREVANGQRTEYLSRRTSGLNQNGWGGRPFCIREEP